jgi:hypothetical protein
MNKETLQRAAELSHLIDVDTEHLELLRWASKNIHKVDIRLAVFGLEDPRHIQISTHLQAEFCRLAANNIENVLAKLKQEFDAL